MGVGSPPAWSFKHPSVPVLVPEVPRVLISDPPNDTQGRQERGWITYPRSHSQKWQSQGLKPGKSGSRKCSEPMEYEDVVLTPMEKKVRDI